jgi:hypothetical protein
MEIKIDYRNQDRELIIDCCKSALWHSVGYLKAVAENDGSYYSDKEVEIAKSILNMIQDCLQPVLVKPDESPKVKIIVGK